MVSEYSSYDIQVILFIYNKYPITYKYKHLCLIKCRYKSLAAFCFPETSLVDEIPRTTADTKPAFAWLCYSLHPRSHTECFEWYIRGFKPLNANENIIFMTNFLLFASRDKQPVLENLPLEKHPTYWTHLNYLNVSARKQIDTYYFHIIWEIALWGLTELRTY